jgi:hypothetical protein
MTHPVETWHYKDNSGLPPAFICLSIIPNEFIYWTQDGEDMKGFKLGTQMNMISDTEK